MTSGGLTSPIKLDADNRFVAMIHFGSAQYPIQISQMKFNTVDLGTVDLSHPSLVAGLSSIVDNKFSATATGSDTSINFKGKFYGPDAQSIGGAWSGTFKNNADVALSGTGVFKAVKE